MSLAHKIKTGFCSKDYMVRGTAFWLLVNPSLGDNFFFNFDILINGEGGELVSHVSNFGSLDGGSLSLLFHKINLLMYPAFLDQILFQLHCYVLSKQSLPF